MQGPVAEFRVLPGVALSPIAVQMHWFLHGKKRKSCVLFDWMSLVYNARVPGRLLVCLFVWYPVFLPTNMMCS
ncbi:hypothetical protein B0J13DRAFT_183751 [Dactylonectria estremocensis]|uniref:Uncharacterized protein n=1 Tax=Dactylonectria estremocensis TaxID=1079267 RepID=A0A9P9FBX0_9HYPO|nr:hypothetical protein B0J13DRAFT_183751 [Dactylonectria estremocensis]